MRPPIALLLVTVMLTAHMLTPPAVRAGDLHDTPAPALKAPEGTVTVHSEPCTPDPATARLVDAMLAAKRKGDEAALESVAAELDQLAGRTRVPQSSPVETRLVVRPELSSRGLRFGDDMLVSDPRWNSGHPAMASTADGQLYVICEDFNNPYVDLYSSDTGGVTWTYVWSLWQGERPENPSIAIGEGTNGTRVLITWEGHDDANGYIYLYWHDLAEPFAWGEVTIASSPLSLAIGNPQICVDCPQYHTWWAYVTYTQEVVTKDRLTSQWVMFSRSTDGGEMWSSPAQVAAVYGMAQTCVSDIAFGALDLFVTWPTIMPPYDNRDVTVRRSTDLGNTWETPVTLVSSSYDEYDPTVASAQFGASAVVAYTIDYDTRTDVESFVSTDAGASWSGPHYLPYTLLSEGPVDLAATRTSGVERYHAAFYGDSCITYTWTDADSLGLWASPGEIVNEGRAACPDDWGPAVAVIPPVAPWNAGIAWRDLRGDPGYDLIVFDASYLTYKACCLEGDVCLIIPGGDCLALGGTYLWACDTCDPNPCPYVGVDEVAPPAGTEFLTVTPNPFPGRAEIRFSLTRPGRARLSIYDVAGRLVRRLMDDGRGAGSHTVAWDGLNADGRATPAGIYFVRLETDEREVTRKVVLLE
jgi:hypothetical protein